VSEEDCPVRIAAFFQEVGETIEDKGPMSEDACAGMQLADTRGEEHEINDFLALQSGG
jgi:hypothetical protein